AKWCVERRSGNKQGCYCSLNHMANDCIANPPQEPTNCRPHPLPVHCLRRFFPLEVRNEITIPRLLGTRTDAVLDPFAPNRSRLRSRVVSRWTVTFREWLGVERSPLPE